MIILGSTSFTQGAVLIGNGTNAVTTSSAKGSATQPIYIDNDGIIQECDKFVYRDEPYMLHFTDLSNKAITITTKEYLESLYVANTTLRSNKTITIKVTHGNITKSFTLPCGVTIKYYLIPLSSFNDDYTLNSTVLFEISTDATDFYSNFADAILYTKFYNR